MVKSQEISSDKAAQGMSEQIFQNPRLVSIYDHFDGERRDLDVYLALVQELGARSILDVGCGTGAFACLASSHGFEVTGVEPAQASLVYAQGKPNAGRVRWIVGDATTLPPMNVDVALMTGNVAQVFLTDQSWLENLVAIRRALNPQGHLVFESRDPTKKAWLEWTREKTYQRITIPQIGVAQGWCEITEVSGQLVSFRWTYQFESDGEVLFSDSTIRFRGRDELELSLHEAGFHVKEVRDAPDRPGKEFVFIATVT